MARGSKAQQRRRIKRSAQRREAQGVKKAPFSTATSEDDALAALVAMGNEDRSVLARRAVAEAITAGAGPSEITTTYDLLYGSLAERAYLSALIQEGFQEERRASWPCETPLGDYGEVLVRSDDSATFVLDDGTLVFIHAGDGWFRMRAASSDRGKLAEAVQVFAQEYPALYRATEGDEQTVPITFWTNGRFGPQARLRRIDSASWKDVEANYSSEVAGELGRLLSDEFVPGKDGQLILWQGSPGTGKTWALRALASEWAPWAEFSYITDPDSFFVTDPSYMIDVLLHESYEAIDSDGSLVEGEKPDGKWRVLILEDTGELLSANAKDNYGQGLSRLLNVVDGMVGQGLRVLCLLTTNDELGELHPAAVRPGRCASQIEFGPLSEEEAQAWLETKVGANALAAGPQTLAELYSLVGGSAEAFVASDMECECGHMAEAHEGADNEGPCTTAGCSCEAFAAADEENDPNEPEPDADVDDFTLDEALALVMDLAKSGSQRLTFTLTDFEAEGAEAPTPDKPIFTGGARWIATLCPEGVVTEDGRIFAPGSITWRDLPLSLMGMVETQPGHDGAQVCGRIDNIWREEETGLIRASGEFDSGEYGQEIARMVGEETLRGVSVDIAPIKVEVANRADVVDENGQWDEQPPPEVEEEEEPKSMLDILFGPEEDVVLVVREGVIGAATVCPFPAFASASIELENSLVAAQQSPMVWTVTQQAGWTVVAISEPQEREEAPVEESLTAAAVGIAPTAPPAEWFDDPTFENLTPFTVTEEGQIYGHAAAWGTCHTGIPGVCTTPPTSETDYAYFHLKEVVCANGERVSVGTITMDAPHASLDLGRAAATDHYDNTAVAAADVRAGEDEFGIWFAGAIRPDLDEVSARRLRGASLSGDWRVVRMSDGTSNRELIALLAVNVPGFPVPRPEVLVASASDGGFEIITQVAAGMHAGQEGLTLMQQRQREATALADEFSLIGEGLDIA